MGERLTSRSRVEESIVGKPKVTPRVTAWTGSLGEFSTPKRRSLVSMQTYGSDSFDRVIPGLPVNRSERGHEWGILSLFRLEEDVLYSFL
jgi:hypothetical protein